MTKTRMIDLAIAQTLVAFPVAFLTMRLTDDFVTSLLATLTAVFLVAAMFAATDKDHR